MVVRQTEDRRQRTEAVFAFVGGMHCLDVNQQGGITEALARRNWMIRGFAPLTLEVAAGADVQHFALQRDRPTIFMPLNPGIPHADSRAKYAVAFFNISRSILTRASAVMVIPIRIINYAPQYTRHSSNICCRHFHVMWSVVT